MPETMKMKCCIWAVLLVVSGMAWGNDVLFHSSFEQPDWKKNWLLPEQESCAGTVRKRNAELLINALMKDGSEKNISIQPVMKALPAEYQCEFTVEFAGKGKRGGHYGVVMNGMQIFVRDKVWATGKNVQGNPHDVVGFASGRATGKNHFKIVNTKTQCLVFVNGNNVLTIDKKEPGDSTLKFYSYNNNIILSGVKISTGQASANLLRNSGFETISSTLPEYWGTPVWGLNDLEWMTRPEEFRKYWTVDTDQAWEGSHSFRIDYPNNAKDATFALVSCRVYVPGNRTYTVSAYLKAQAENTRVKFGVRGATLHELVLEKEWKRYSFTSDEINERSQLVLLPVDHAPVWIDAVQLEEGTQPTAYGKHIADTLASTPRQAKLNAFIPFTKTKPDLDGVLNEEIWASAFKTELDNRTDSLPVVNRTTVKMLCDSQNLYFAVECFEPDMTKLKADVIRHKGNVWEDDAVEIFLKPTPSSDIYYQFVINTIGTCYEGRTFSDSVWVGSWKNAVRKYDDRWVVEAAIPLSTLGMLPDDHVLGFNIGRSNPRLKEFSSIAQLTSFMNFNDFEKLTMDLPVVTKQDQNAKEKTPDPRLVREFSVFTNEPELRFKLVNPPTKDYNWVCRLFRDEELVAEQKMDSREIAAFANTHGVGMYRVDATLNCGERKWSFSEKFRVVATQPYESKVNYWTHRLVSAGKDFHLWGICLEMPGVDRKLVEYLSKNNFNFLEIVGWYSDKSTPLPVDLVKTAYDLGQEYGMKVLFNFAPGGGSRVNGIIAIEEHIGPHPSRLLGNPYDEPSFLGFDKKVFQRIDDEYARLHEKIGYNLAMFQNDYDLGVIRNFNYSNADVVSLDHYPVPARDISSIYYLLKKLKAIAGDRPICFYPQTGGNAYHISRLPREDELINSYYQAMAADCWNFITFSNIPVEPFYMPTLKKLQQEWKTLLDAGMDIGEPLTGVTCSSPEIAFLARKTPAGNYIVAVNLSRSPVSCVFRNLPKGNVKVMFEDRSILNSGDSIQDPFAPLERHVYRY